MCLGVPARVVEVEGFEATVDMGGGVRRRVLLLVEGVSPNDYVIVHAGVAIGKVRPEEALELISILREVSSSVEPELAEELTRAEEELRRRA